MCERDTPLLFLSIVTNTFVHLDSALVTAWIGVFVMEFVLMGNGIALARVSFNLSVYSVIFPLATIVSNLYVVIAVELMVIEDRV